MKQEATHERGTEEVREEVRVAALRCYLRSASDLQAAGRLEEASRVRGQADELLVELTARLTRRLDRYARAYLPEASRDTIQEAIRQMFALFCERMHDLSSGQRLWEERFNLCLKRMAIDAVRNIRHQNGLRLDGSPMAPGGGLLVSLDAPEEQGDDADDFPPLAERVADPAAVVGFTSVLGKQVAEQLLAQLPRQQAQVFTDRMNGVSWEETAARAGVSVSTAQHRYNDARARLREILARRDWEEALR